MRHFESISPVCEHTPPQKRLVSLQLNSFKINTNSDKLNQKSMILAIGWGVLEHATTRGVV